MTSITINMPAQAAVTKSGKGQQQHQEHEFKPSNDELNGASAAITITIDPTSIATISTSINSGGLSINIAPSSLGSAFVSATDRTASRPAEDMLPPTPCTSISPSSHAVAEDWEDNIRRLEERLSKLEARATGGGELKVIDTAMEERDSKIDDKLEAALKRITSTQGQSLEAIAAANVQCVLGLSTAKSETEIALNLLKEDQARAIQAIVGSENRVLKEIKLEVTSLMKAEEAQFTQSIIEMKNSALGEISKSHTGVMEERKTFKKELSNEKASFQKLKDQITTLDKQMEEQAQKSAKLEADLLEEKAAIEGRKLETNRMKRAYEAYGTRSQKEFNDIVTKGIEEVRLAGGESLCLMKSAEERLKLRIGQMNEAANNLEKKRATGEKQLNGNIGNGIHLLTSARNESISMIKGEKNKIRSDILLEMEKNIEEKRVSLAKETTKIIDEGIKSIKAAKANALTSIQQESDRVSTIVKRDLSEKGKKQLETDNVIAKGVERIMSARDESIKMIQDERDVIKAIIATTPSTVTADPASVKATTSIDEQLAPVLPTSSFVESTDSRATAEKANVASDVLIPESFPSPKSWSDIVASISSSDQTSSGSQSSSSPGRHTASLPMRSTKLSKSASPNALATTSIVDDNSSPHVKDNTVSASSLFDMPEFANTSGEVIFSAANTSPAAPVSESEHMSAALATATKGAPDSIGTSEPAKDLDTPGVIKNTEDNENVTATKPAEPAQKGRDSESSPELRPGSDGSSDSASEITSDSESYTREHDRERSESEASGKDASDSDSDRIEKSDCEYGAKHLPS